MNVLSLTMVCIVVFVQASSKRGLQLEAIKVEILIKLRGERIKIIKENTETIHFQTKIAIGLVTRLDKDLNAIVLIDRVISILEIGSNVTVFAFITHKQHFLIS